MVSVINVLKGIGDVSSGTFAEVLLVVISIIVCLSAGLLVGYIFFLVIGSFLGELYGTIMAIVGFAIGLIAGIRFIYESAKKAMRVIKLGIISNDR